MLHRLLIRITRPVHLPPVADKESLKRIDTAVILPEHISHLLHMLQYNVKILRFILLVLPVPVIEETDDPFLVAVRHGCKQLPDI